jgi:hypothetical protein
MRFPLDLYPLRAKAAKMFCRVRLFAGPLVFGIAIAVPGGTLFAQQIVVQEPVVEHFSGSTTVSVPDRGRAFVGGVGRSASSSSSYGPFRANRNFGRSTSGTGVSVHVWIHDFEELDRQALEAAGKSESHLAGSRPLSRADQAYETLKRRSRVEPSADTAFAARNRSFSRPTATKTSAARSSAENPLSSAADARRSRRSRR